MRSQFGRWMSAAATLCALSVLTGAELAAQQPLEVPGYHPASHVAPDGEGPNPVVVVLHGNFDRPEWECAIWAEVASHYGWVLCPRGLPRKDTAPSLDRWTYGSRKKVRAEIAASLDALEARYPGRVQRDGMVLAGFSLGGIMAPDIVVEDTGTYTWMFLVEGGLRKLTKRSPAALRKAGLRGVGFAMSANGRRKRAGRWVKKYRASGLAAEFVDMEGSGHGYSRDFAKTGRAAFDRLLAGPPEPAQ